MKKPPIATAATTTAVSVSAAAAAEGSLRFRLEENRRKSSPAAWNYLRLFPDFYSQISQTPHIFFLCK